MKITPTTLSIVTTLQCTAACESCCFQCSPKIKESISNETIFRLIEEAKHIPSIKVVVFTGGEPFLRFDDLCQFVEKASSYGYFSRIVTNCFWAKNPDTALLKLKQLKEIGLTEINFSTGDEHQKFVDLNNILNAIEATIACDLPCTINVEAIENSNFKFSQITDKEHIKFAISIGLVRVIHGFWNKKNENPNKNILTDLQEKPCDYIFETLTIFPNNDVTFCCGLTVRTIENLIAGSAEKNKLIEIIQKNEPDLLKMAIRAWGPHKILEKINLLDDDIKYKHPCEQCKYLFSIALKNIEKINKVLLSNEENIIDAYFIKTKCGL